MRILKDYIELKLFQNENNICRFSYLFLMLIVKINIALYNIKNIIPYKSHDRVKIFQKMSFLGKRKG